MPDSYNYTTFVYDPLGDAFTPFKLLNAIGEWLDATVQNGWEYLHYTGKHSGAFDPDHVDYVTSNDPLQDAYSQSVGIHPVVNPSGDPDRAQTVYLRWSDGDSLNWENYFHLSTIDMGGAAFNDIRTGYYTAPYVTPIENPQSWGLTWDADASNWIGTPSGNATDYGYAAWPTGSLNPGVRDSSTPTNYRAQPGYVGREAVTNQLNEGALHCTNPNPLVTCHVFAGVDNGGPFLYCCIESGEQEAGVSEKFYTHFGVGRISKFGEWKGGQFACGTSWSNSQTNTPWSEYHSRMFGSWSNRYNSGASSHIAFSTDMRPYDDQDPTTEPTNYLFGYNYGSYPYTAYSSLDGGTGLGSYIQGDARLNTWRNEALTIPSYITLDDITTSYDFLVGAAPAIRSCWMTNIHEGDTIVNEGETWMVFPMKCRNSVHGLARSDDYGYAYRIA